MATVLAALLGVCAYGNTLGHGLVYDDSNAIVRNSAVRDPADWHTIFLTPSWMPPGDRTAISYRPFATWTLAVDYALHGVRPFGYHLVNVLGHCVVSGLVVLLVSAFGLSASAAGVAGVLFALHPVHTEVVANGVGRAEILSAALAVAALICARRAAAANWPLVHMVGAIGLYALALLSKENSVALLAVIPFADFMVADNGSPAIFFRHVLGRRCAFYTALLGITGGYLAIRAVALGSIFGAGAAGPQSIPFWANPAASMPAASRVLTGFEVFGLASRLLVWPYSLSADYSYRQIPVISSITDPRAWAGMLVAAALVVSIVLLAQRNRTACVWLGLAALTYGVVSNIPFPIGTIFGERLLYLPSAGVCALAGMVATARMPRLLAATTAGLTGMAIITWFIATVQRNPVWHDDLSLGTSMVASAPDSVHAHHFLGAMYVELGREEEGVAELRRALDILPDHVSSLYDLATILDDRRESDEAMALYRRVVEMDATFFPAWINLSVLENRRGNLLPALDAADHAVAAAPAAPATHMTRANALRALGREAEARDEYATGLVALARAALNLRDYQLASDAFRRLVDVAPSADAYRGLIDSLTQAGRRPDAEGARAAAHERYPADATFGRTAGPARTSNAVAE